MKRNSEEWLKIAEEMPELIRIINKNSFRLYNDGPRISWLEDLAQVEPVNIELLTAVESEYEFLKSLLMQYLGHELTKTDIGKTCRVFATGIVPHQRYLEQVYNLAYDAKVLGIIEQANIRGINHFVFHPTPEYYNNIKK